MGRECIGSGSVFRFGGSGAVFRFRFQSRIGRPAPARRPRAPEGPLRSWNLNLNTDPGRENLNTDPGREPE